MTDIKTDVIPEAYLYTNPITLKQYQEKAKETAIYPEEAKVTYTLLGLAGEVGELCNKLKKLYRDHGATQLSIFTIPATVIYDLEKEIGDVLWYVAALCSDLGLELNDIGIQNLDKLSSRKERGKIKGEGDDR